MKKKFARTLAVTVAAIGFSASSAMAGFNTFVIRYANPSNAVPVIQVNNTYQPGATEFIIAEGGQKAGWGSSDIDGSTLGSLTSVSIDRLDDRTRFAAGSGPYVAPYLNVWITDGNGNYAVVGNEPSDPVFQPLYSGGYHLTWADLANKPAKIYENSNRSWLPACAATGQGTCTFADLAGYIIQPPSVAKLNAGWPGLGGGAPREIGTQKAWGVNWVFGDTLTSYVSGAEGYVVIKPGVTAPAPSFNQLVVTPVTPVFDSNNVVGVPGDYAPGFAGGSFASNGSAKTDMYFTPQVLFGRDITVGEVATMGYFTKKGSTHAADIVDWFLVVYTKPFVGQAAPNFYGARFGTEPYFSANLNDPADSWNEWTTDGTANRLRFFESTNGAPGANFGTYTDPQWTTFINSNSLGTTVPRRNQQVASFSVQTGSCCAAGFTGQVDGLTIELTDGSIATVNFEPADGIPPTIAGSAAPAANSFGWNNTNVTVSFTCTDNAGGAGIAIDTVAGATLTSEGAGQSVTSTGICKDNAGNLATMATVSGIKIDKTNPTFGACTNDSFAYGTGSQPVSITANDALSGIDASGSTLTGSVNTNVLGTATVNYTAKDKAGNTSITSCNYQVLSVNQVKQAVLASLQALLPSLTKPNSDRVKAAIDHLNKSLNPKYWVDGLHLTKDGKPVFDEEKRTVHELEYVSPRSLVQSQIDALVADDRMLATIAIAASTKPAADITKANNEIAKGDADAANGKYEEAIGHYKNAWDLAT